MAFTYERITKEFITIACIILYTIFVVSLFEQFEEDVEQTH